jgi:hypothetical protein
MLQQEYQMEMSDIVRTAIKIGLRNGFVTVSQLNELLAEAGTEPEDIEALFMALSEQRIEVREDS